MKVIRMYPLCLAILLLFGCEDKGNQIVGNKVAGTWKVERIRFNHPSRPGTDSVLVLKGATITFDPCTFSGEAYSNCPGSYQLIGSKKTNFLFQAYGNNSESVYLPSIPYPYNDEFKLNAGYVLSFSNDNKRLEMKGYLSWNDGSDKGNFVDQNAYLTLSR